MKTLTLVLEMSFIYRPWRRLSNGSLLNRASIVPISSKFGNFKEALQIFRNYSLPAKASQEEEEDLEMIDQRKLPTDYNPSNFDPTEHRSPPSSRVFRLVDEIAGLTLGEIAELSSILMKKMNMKEGPTIAVMKAGSVGVAARAATGEAKEEKKPEKTIYELKLEGYNAAAKIKIIKEVRTFTDLGLKEAKELVEKASTVIKKGVSKEEGEQIVEKLKALGAKVVME